MKTWSNCSIGAQGTPAPSSKPSQWAVGFFTITSSITGINLTLTTDVTIDGTDEGILSFQFHFTHDETDNAASPCADGGHVGVGLDAFDKLLLVEPVVAAAARVGAGLQQIARDLR